MGKQQIHLLILGAIIVIIAVVGISQFSAHSTQSNKDGVMLSLQSISANAYQYKIRTITMGGGAGSYIGYTMPSKMTADANGTYALSTIASDSCQIIGTSKVNTAWTATGLVLFIVEIPTTMLSEGLLFTQLSC